METNKQYLSVEDMSEYLKCTPQYVRKLIREGKIPAQQVGKTWVIESSVVNNKEIILTTLEFDLLNMFLQNKGKSFSRDEILSKVWGENYYGTDRVVDDLIRRLRKKMTDLNINTIYGYGYRLV